MPDFDFTSIRGRQSVLLPDFARLAPRWLVLRSANNATLTLLQPRWAMSYLRGPMTQSEIRRARAPR